MVALYVAAPVHRDRVARRLDRDVRAFSDNRDELHLESAGKQLVEPFGFRPRESRLSAYPRKLVHRGDHLEPEIIGDQILEDPRAGMIKIFEKSDYPLLLLSRSHRLSPLFLSMDCAR